MHKLLTRQLRKYLNSGKEISPELNDFIKAVNNSYHESDKQYTILENTFDQNSNETYTELNNLRTAIDEAAMVVVINRNGYIHFVNNSFRRLCGFSTSELCSKTVYQHLGNNFSEVIKKARIQLKNNKTWKGEISFKTKNNQTIWLHSTVVPRSNAKGKVDRYMSIMIDITSRKIYEEEIIKSENKYKQVINSVKEVIFQADNKSDWTFLNSAWAEITGFHALETLGTSVFDYIHPEDKSRFKDGLQKLFSEKNESLNGFARFLTKDGCYKWIDIFIKLIKDERGVITGLSGTLNDVTEKHRNEELLLKSYSFQRAILDSAKQAIISTDLSGYIRTFNSGAEQMLGYPAEEVVGQIDISKLFDPKSIAHFNAESTTDSNANAEVWFSGLLHESTGESAEEREHVFISKKGTPIYVMLSLTAIRDHDGNTTGHLFIANDNSKRRKAESENIKLNKILEETPDYVVYYDLDNRPLYCNKAYKEIRYENEFETTQPLHPAWVELIIRKKAIPYAIEHGSWKGETAILDQKGNEIPVLQLIIIHKDEKGNPVFRSSVMRDITQRKQYEHRLLLSEKRNRDLINYSQGVICTHDLNGTIISINPAGCELLGYTMDEIVGSPIMDFMVPEHISIFKKEYLKGFDSVRTAEGILTLVQKSGTKLHLLYKNFKVDENNGDSYIIGFAQDITERLRAENDLKSAKHIAEESSKAKELFLANMSHEIRTPMNGIVGLTNLLLRSPLQEKQQQYALSVKHSAENLLVIINDILDFSKIHAGKLEIAKKPFDINNLIYNIRQSFQLEAQKKGINLITNIEDNLHPVLIGDQVRLNQIIGNLISNAIKFTENGSVTFKVSQLEESEKVCHLRMEVEDTGIGIPQDKLKKVFKSFTQANANTTRKYGGTGLGLSIVKNLLDLMGGHIYVNSEEGHGSLFYFDLIFEKGNQNIEHFTQETEINVAGKLSKFRFLLAEDNQVNQLFAQELINEWGAALDIADNGKIALELLQKNTYDIVLMDIQMPEMSGLEATAYIRSELKSPLNKIPIIAMTANAMKGDDKKYLDAGMNDVVFKPFLPMELFHKICNNLPDTKLLSSNKIEQVPIETAKIEIQEEPQLKFASLHVLKSFSRGKNEFLNKMLAVLIETVPESIEVLDKAISENNIAEIKKTTHKMIPNMNMMGVKFIEEEIKWIENNVENGNYRTQIKTKWIKIKPLITSALNELEIAKQYYAKITVTKAG